MGDVSCMFLFFVKCILYFISQHSHYHELSFQVDCNPNNVILENRMDNLSRYCCSFFPTKKCICRTPCIIPSSKLEELSFMRECYIEKLTWPFGNHGSKGDRELCLDILTQYELKREELFPNESPPAWIQNHRLHHSTTQNHFLLIIGCDECNHNFESFTAYNAHESTCSGDDDNTGDVEAHANEESSDEGDDTTDVGARPTCNSRDLSESRMIEIEELINKYGWGDCKLLEDHISFAVTGTSMRLLIQNRKRFRYLKPCKGWVYGYERIVRPANNAKDMRRK